MAYDALRFRGCETFLPSSDFEVVVRKEIPSMSVHRVGRPTEYVGGHFCLWPPADEKRCSPLRALHHVVRNTRWATTATVDLTKIWVPSKEHADSLADVREPRGFVTHLRRETFLEAVTACRQKPARPNGKRAIGGVFADLAKEPEAIPSGGLFVRESEGLDPLRTRRRGLHPEKLPGLCEVSGSS